MSGQKSDPNKFSGDLTAADRRPDDKAATAKVADDAAIRVVERSHDPQIGGAGAAARGGGSAAPIAATTAGDKIAVGCKLPHGLVIQLEAMREARLPNGAVEQRYVPVGAPITLKGSNSSQVIGGYGITEGVNEEAFNAWLKSHDSFEPVVKGLIFAMPNSGDAAARAREQSGVRSGFEPLDPHRPGAGLTPEDDQKALLPPAA